MGLIVIYQVESVVTAVGAGGAGVERGGLVAVGEDEQRLAPLRLHDAVQLRSHLPAPPPVRLQLALRHIAHTIHYTLHTTHSTLYGYTNRENGEERERSVVSGVGR